MHAHVHVAGGMTGEAAEEDIHTCTEKRLRKTYTMYKNTYDRKSG